MSNTIIWNWKSEIEVVDTLQTKRCHNANFVVTDIQGRHETPGDAGFVSWYADNSWYSLSLPNNELGFVEKILERIDIRQTDWFATGNRLLI